MSTLRRAHTSYAVYGIVRDLKASAIIRHARVRAGLTQVGLAKRAGTSQAAISRRERDAEQPTLAALERLVYACGMRLDVRVEPLPPSPRRETLLSKRREIEEQLRRHGASNPRIFGSVARGEDHEGSDVDLLVDLPRPRSGTSRLLAALSLSDALSEVTGLRIDVSTEDFLEPEIRNSALADAVAL